MRVTQDHWLFPMASSSIKTIDAYSVSIHFEVVLIYNLGSHSREQIYWEKLSLSSE